ncbi:IS3 family transposase [Planococcus shenhongbingii]|uniref:IS3 family transposase n=1 Tax=Planococcus shenhongbingii TaxID=3058398 RepID=A0ABT8NCN1_9BACL|nr:IS3 family transposase [Planococcus sp. N017]MDN7245634.1 IS3 family transposase [Planococcus sp. N017]
MIESFHSTIKSEEFQYVKFTSLNNFQVVEKVTGYLHYYNEERILEKQAARHPRNLGPSSLLKFL